MQRTLQNLLHSFTTVDPRSLLWFRIALGMSILLDLCISQFKNVPMYFSDAGAFPRRLLVHDMAFSIFNIAGSNMLNYLLLTVLGTAALCMIVGWRTKLASVIAFVFTISLHARTEFMLSGADRLQTVVLFWAMFLPLGHYYSIDQLRTKTPKLFTLHHRLAVLGLILVASCLYGIAAYLKMPDPTWSKDFTAVYYVFNSGSHVNPIGNALKYSLALTQLLTLGAIIIEWILGFALLIPVYIPVCRLVFAILALTLNLGFASTMYVGNFPIVGIALATLFVPSFAWNWLTSKLPANILPATHVYIKKLHMLLVEQKQSIAHLTKVTVSIGLTAFLVFNIILQIWTNADDIRGVNLPAPQIINAYWRNMRLSQSWSMFHVSPKSSGWPQILLTTEGGKTYDLWRKEWDGRYTVSPFGPETAAIGYKNSLRNYNVFKSLRQSQNIQKRYHAYYSYYHCNQWNAANEDKAKTITMNMKFTVWDDPYNTHPFEEEYWTYTCP